MFFRYSSGDDIIPYSITTVDQNIQLSGVPGFSVGGTYTLNTPYITGRNYGIQFSVADCEYLHAQFNNNSKNICKLYQQHYSQNKSAALVTLLKKNRTSRLYSFEVCHSLVLSLKCCIKLIKSSLRMTNRNSFYPV